MREFFRDYVRTLAPLLIAMTFCLSVTAIMVLA